MKVLVTGAGGFIGSHLVEMLVRNVNIDVKAMVRYNSKGSLGWMESSSILQNYDFDIFYGDVRDYDSVDRAMKGVEVVFHLAALVGIPYSLESPISYIETNIKGTHNVLCAARKTGARVMIFSSSEVFGRAISDSLSESHPQMALSPYAATKICTDQLAKSYEACFGLDVSIIRPFNVYGPRQSMRALIPTVIAQALSGADEIRLGNLESRRDYTHVADLCEILIKIMDEYDDIEVNIGSGKTWPIGDLAKKIIHICGSDAKVVEDPKRKRDSRWEVPMLCCDNDLARKMGWEPKLDMHSGLMNTIEWFKENLDKYRPDEYCI